jgi:hypothetical protein
VQEAVREERAERSVGESPRQCLLLTGASFTLEEAPRNLAGRVALLAVFDGEREERKVGGSVGHGHRAQHHRFPVLHQTGARRELRHPSDLEDQGSSRELPLDALNHLLLFSLSLPLPRPTPSALA